MTMPINPSTKAGSPPLPPIFPLSHYSPRGYSIAPAPLKLKPLHRSASQHQPQKGALSDRARQISLEMLHQHDSVSSSNRRSSPLKKAASSSATTTTTSSSTTSRTSSHAPRLLSISTVGLASDRLANRACAARIRSWILAFCVVDFDLDYGPTIATVYPPHPFTEEEAKIIAFSSFPDSAICDLCEIVYTFRVRLRNPKPVGRLQPPTGQPRSASTEQPPFPSLTSVPNLQAHRPRLNSVHHAGPPQSGLREATIVQLMNKLRLEGRSLGSSPPSHSRSADLGPAAADSSFYYAYVFFRQKKDPFLKRGCFQKSLVLISPLPYHGLFTKIVRLLGPPYFELGHSILETAAHSIGTDWPSPYTGEMPAPTLREDVDEVYVSPSTSPLSLAPSSPTSPLTAEARTPTEEMLPFSLSPSPTPTPTPIPLLSPLTSNGSARSTIDPPPQSGAGPLVDLPFLGSTLQVELPPPSGHQLLETCAFDMSRLDPSHQILATVQIDGLFSAFEHSLEDLWKCWELMMVGEPLVVMADSPAECSQAVLALVDLIQPITYCGDVRPYFTIQDAEFKSYVSKTRIPPNVVLGVSNPFFDQALEHWPHIIHLGQSRRRRESRFTSSRLNQRTRQAGGTANSSASKASNVLASLQIQSPQWLSNETHRSGLQTKWKSVVGKDRALLAKITTAAEAGYTSSYILNNILRRHFLDLTEKFLAPLNRYFSTLIPKTNPLLHSNLTNRPYSQQPQPQPQQLRLQLKPFNQEDFLKSLHAHGSQIPLRNSFGSNVDYIVFYRQFLTCGNFATWLHARTEQAQVELLKRYRQSLCTTDLLSWVKNRRDAEVIELLLILRSEINSLSQMNGNESLPSSSQAENGWMGRQPNAHTPSTDPQNRETRVKLIQQAQILLEYLSPELRHSLDPRHFP
ncbi:hypothetical protein H4R33_004109 [Dimargaris cristalligena]|nr:hypothetical protein H4R33_004109 [Dimargaris cristalligena]